MSTASKFSGKSSWFSRLSAVVVSSAMAMTMGIAAAPAANAYEAKLTTVGEKVEYSTQKRVPAVESSIGVGSLAADGTVALPGTAGYDSALVRVSLFAPAQDTTISVAGSPALFAAAGQDASATVLAPVADGKAQISASANANVRVEVLATFKNDAKTPGATNSVAQPVARGAAALGAEQSVGITGLGGVPATDVRAAYVTADVTLSQAGTVTLGGQTLDLPQGHTVVSTIVVPDAQQGDIKVSSTADGSIALAVRGWVAGSAENAEQVNVEGSYVPTSGADWSTSAASQSKAGAIDVPGATDRALSLALVSATKSANTSRTFVDVGENIAGRSEGVLVDAAKGAAPQLEIVESTTAQAKVSVRGDAVNASVLPLGDVLGTPAASKGTVDVAITAPNDGASINLAETGGITLKGTVKSSAAVDHVEVYGNDTKIGNAAVQYTADGLTWSMQVASPESQKVTYKAVVVARDDAKGDARITTQVTLPSADDTVINPDAVVVDPNDPSNPVTGLTSDTVTFANEPSFGINKVIVSGVGNAAPEGFIRRVVAIDHTDAGWVVTTKPATLTEVFEQANIDHSETAMKSNLTTVTENENTNPDVVVEPGDKETTTIVPIDQLDMSDPVDDSANATRLGSRTLAARPQSRAGGSSESGHEVGLKTSFNFSFPGEDVDHTGEPDADKVKDFSKDEKGDEKAKKAAEASGGIAVSFEAALTLGAHLKLDIDAHWNWFKPDVTLKEFRATIYGEEKAKVSASVFGKVEKKFVDDDFASLHTPTIRFMAGPIPIVFKTDVSVGFEAKATGEATIEFSVEEKRTFEKGAKFVNGQWKKVDENQNTGKKNDPCLPDGHSVKLSGKASLEAGPTLSAGVRLYGVIGPKIEAGAKSEIVLEGSTSTDNEAKVELSIDAIISGAVKIEFTVPIIDKTIADWTMVEASYKKNFLHIELSVDRTCPANSGTGGGSSNGDTDDDNNLTGTVTDATTGLPIIGAEISVIVSGAERNTYADRYGDFSIALPSGSYEVKISSPGYVDWTKQIDMASGDQHITAALTKPTSSTTEWRAVLTWGEQPRDEDSHLIGNSDAGAYHVYYSDKEAYDAEGKRVAWLDVDDTTSYGPETLTFDVSDSGTYSYYVHNYSAEAPLNTSGAEVRLYRGDQLVRTYNIPANWGDQNIWQVFSIQNGQVVDYVEQPAAASAMSRAAVEPKKQ